MNKTLLGLYSDYLISSFSYTTAIGLSRATDGCISHDKVTRFLSEEDFTSKHLWRLVKPTVRRMQSPEGILLFDDTIEEKPSTDENEFITWHWDHLTGQTVKGFNLLSALYYSQGVLFPVGFQPITKTESVTDMKPARLKRNPPEPKTNIYEKWLK
jgi:hypothetical protein